MASFVKDVEEIRQRAIDKIEDGAVTATYKGDVDRTIAILNEALATEIVCVLRYMHHYFMATGVHGRSVANEFKEHADAEREHGDMIAERIQQLGGKPDFNPASLLQRSVSQYIEGETLADMLREDLIAERMVIEVYQEMIRHFGNNDPTTRTMIEHILSEEEEHASDLSDLLYVVDPHTGETEGRDPGTDPLKMQRTEDEVAANVRIRSREVENVRGRDRKYDGIQEQMATPPEHGPGTTGRTMNRRKSVQEEETEEPAERPNRGAASGGTHSPKILQKNRKNKRVA